MSPVGAPVSYAIARLLPGGYPTVQRTAKELGLSPRTLQRRLEDAGITYRELVQACRFGRACHLLAVSTLHVSEIARELGYADPSSFSRFFLRAAGKTPRTYRAEARSTSPPGRDRESAPADVEPPRPRPQR
ncbi:MAG: helix-turn-helix transcriptional regulator [Deltaproteobacteria bacterium]|nr:helix-turn-helix transcriptional regulator [Deltaproteobacteria bacterium]